MAGISEQMIYVFDNNSSSDWQIVDDVVMGGRSNGAFSVNKNGNGVFSGKISLENNGGFSSVMHSISEPKDLSEFSHVKLKVKGDGSIYQFRMKENANDRHAYKHEFKTTGMWQEIDLAFKDFIPSFRGRTLDLPSYTGSALSEIRFLIGNKKTQEFRLEVEFIKVFY